MGGQICKKIEFTPPPVPLSLKHERERNTNSLKNFFRYIIRFTMNK